MKVEITYEVQVTVDEDDGEKVENALLASAKTFDAEASVEETDCTEVEEEEEDGDVEGAS